MNVISVSRGVVTGDGEGHQRLVILLKESTCFYRREVVGLVLITVDGKMGKCDPGNAGYRVSICRWRCLRLAKNAMISTERFLVLNIVPVKV